MKVNKEFHLGSSPIKRSVINKALLDNFIHWSVTLHSIAKVQERCKKVSTGSVLKISNERMFEAIIIENTI